MEKLEKEPSVPNWVLKKFAEPLEKERPNPVANQIAPNATDLIISFAKKEIILASNNLKFITDSQLRVKERMRLAENLLVMGEFREALKYADSPELRNRIRVYQEAIGKPDGLFCKCQEVNLSLKIRKFPSAVLE